MIGPRLTSTVLSTLSLRAEWVASGIPNKVLTVVQSQEGGYGQAPFCEAHGVYLAFVVFLSAK
jgi:hypothetical protein